MPRPSDLETTFVNYWRLLAASHPQPIAEYPFAHPRRFRFDFAWPNDRVAVELEGAVYSGGRHTRGKGYEGDLEKYNLATLLNWRLLRYSRSMLDADPEGCIRQITTLLQETDGQGHTQLQGG